MRVMLIERSILILLVAGLLVGVLAIVKPFTTAILFGAVLATAAWPLRQVLVHRGVGRGFAAALLFALSLSLVVLPILIVAPHLADQLSQATQRFEAFFSAAPEKPAWIDGLPVLGRRLSGAWDKLVTAEGDLRTLVEPYTTHFEQWLIGAAGALSDSLVQLILSLIAAAMFWANGDGLVAMLHDALRRLGGPVAEQALDVAAGASTRRRLWRDRHCGDPGDHSHARIGSCGDFRRGHAGVHRTAARDQPNRRPLADPHLGRRGVVAIPARIGRMGHVHDRLGRVRQHR